MKLQDKIALVTGGSQGLGRAICRRLATEGCHVVVADLNEEGAKETAALIAKETERQAIGVKVDVTHEAEVEAVVKQTVQKFGRLDILVANAGILISGPVTEFDADKWRLVLDVNLAGYFLAVQTCGPDHENAKKWCNRSN